MDDESEQVHEKIIYVNPQYSIAENAQAISDSGIKGSGLTASPNKTSMSWNLDISNWFSGPALSLTMDCYDCIGGKSRSNIISLINKV